MSNKTHQPDVLPQYEGWQNYATWAVNLWLTNDEGSYKYLQDSLLDLQKEAAVHTTYELADFLQEWVEELVFGDDEPATLATDLLGFALGYVDWLELAEAYLRDFAKKEAK